MGNGEMDWMVLLDKERGKGEVRMWRRKETGLATHQLR